MKVKIVSQRFEKFFNFNEPLAAAIDWSTAKVTEKLDGSIIGGWFDENSWHFSTNGVINAFNCDLQTPTRDCSSFGELFVLAACETSRLSWEEFLKTLDSKFMYTWELCTPFNRMVVPFRENKIFLIGLRDSLTLEELDVWIHSNVLPLIPRPRVYPAKSREELAKTLSSLPYDEEGYVVMDSSFHRTKWKGSAYLQAHHLKDNGNVNPRRVLELVKLNEIDEYLSYFPEYTDIFNQVKSKYDKTMEMISGIKDEVISMNALYSSDRKAFALQVLQKPEKVRKYYFAAYDGNENKFKTMIDSIDYDDLI